MKKRIPLLLLICLITIASCINKKVTRIEATISSRSIYLDEDGINLLPYPGFQKNNPSKMERFVSIPSSDLLDNHIGDMYSLYPQAHPEHPGFENPQDFAERINSHGLKYMRVSLDWFDGNEIIEAGSYSEFVIKSQQESAIDALIEKGIDVNYALVFWDEQIEIGESYSRFKDELEIQHYLDYVRFIVDHFKGRIKYYSILNEPDIGKGTQQYVAPEDYIELVKRAVPVIREIDPSAKIIIGEVTPLTWKNSIYYMNQIIESDVLPLVDGLSWHSAGWSSPEYMATEYFEYQVIIQDIIEKARNNGFDGEFWATEMHWRTSDSPHPDEFDGYSGISAAKYLASSIVRHSGFGFNIGLAENLEHVNKQPVIENLATILAGVEPIEIRIHDDTNFEKLSVYGFQQQNGDYLIAIWLDEIADDNFPGKVVDITITVPYLSANKIMGVDILNSKQQELVYSTENSTFSLSDFIIRDYPICIWIVSN